MGDVVVGTCSWTDKTMIERWYPRGVSSAEARLRYYAARYDTVEVDSTFYGLPREDYARHWAERTPERFTFHVKAYGLMTGHEVDERSLTPELREYGYELSRSGRVRRPEQRMVDRSFELFVDALTPLAEAGKMGGVLMQYPASFAASDREHEHRHLEQIDRAAAILDPLPVFVEFRHSSWVTGPQLGRTMKFLSDRRLTYVAVDAPQLIGAHTMPPVTAATSSYGYVRFHGRNKRMWNARTASAADRFDYLYDIHELAEWGPSIVDLSSQTERTWVMFNNCKYDYAPRNAREMARILGPLVAPRDWGALTGEPAGIEGHSGDTPDSAHEDPFATGRLF